MKPVQNQIDEIIARHILLNRKRVSVIASVPEPDPSKTGEIMKIEYDVTLDDLIHFNTHHFNHSPAMRRMVSNTRLILVVVVMTVMTVFSHETGKWQIFMPVGVVFSTIYAFRINYLMTKRVAKMAGKVLDKNASREMLGRHVLELHDDGVFVKGAFSEGKTLWSGLTEVAEDAGYVYIYIGPVKAHVIRRGGVVSGDIDAVVEVIRGRIVGQ